GVELERDAHCLPGVAEAGGELGEIEAVGRAREGGAEAAVLAFEDVLDACEAARGEERAVEAALRGAAGVHALHHRAVLRGHQARRLSAGDAERMDGLLRIQVQAARSGGGSGENADGGAGVPALANVFWSHAKAD